MQKEDQERGGWKRKERHYTSKCGLEQGDAHDRRRCMEEDGTEL